VQTHVVVQCDPGKPRNIVNNPLRKGGCAGVEHDGVGSDGGLHGLHGGAERLWTHGNLTHKEEEQGKERGKEKRRKRESELLESSAAWKRVKGGRKEGKKERRKEDKTKNKRDRDREREREREGERGREREREMRMHTFTRRMPRRSHALSTAACADEAHTSSGEVIPCTSLHMSRCALMASMMLSVPPLVVHPQTSGLAPSAPPPMTCAAIATISASNFMQEGQISGCKGLHKLYMPYASLSSAWCPRSPL
jgi:hypothetical protein